MNVAGVRGLYSVQSALGRDLRTMYLDMARSVSGEVNRWAVAGVVPERQLDAVVERAGDVAARYFAVGRRVFDSQNRALTPYATLLNRALVRVTRRAVEPHAALMDKRLQERVKRWLVNARPPATEIVYTDPLRDYFGPHAWIDPNGYVLSTRIWRAGQNTRLRIEALLTDGIRRGVSAIDLSKMLEQFLVPGRSLRTTMPYGRDASFYGMTLARSEITRQHSLAALAAARANPFVASMEYRLSIRHPRFDICDGFAAGSPYPVNACPVPVMDTHPNCLCALIPIVTETPTAVSADLEAMMTAGEPAPFTPLSLDAFLILLLGAALVNSITDDAA